MVVGPLGALVLRAGCCLCGRLRSVPVSSGPVGLGLVSQVGAHRLNVRLVPAGGVCGAWVRVVRHAGLGVIHRSYPQATQL